MSLQRLASTRTWFAVLALCAGGALSAGAPSSPGVAFKTIKTRAELKHEVASAAAAKHPLMVWVRAQWALSALDMESKTFSDPAVAMALKEFVLLRADISNFDSEDKDLLAEWNLRGAPAVLFYGADGTEQRNFRVLGFMKAAAFAAMVRAASAKAPGTPQ